LATPNSPWVLTRLSSSSAEISPTPSLGDTLASLPQISPKEQGQHRNRTSLLSAFRAFIVQLNEDCKCKRKSVSKGTMNAPFVHGVDRDSPSASSAGFLQSHAPLLTIERRDLVLPPEWCTTCSSRAASGAPTLEFCHVFYYRDHPPQGAAHFMSNWKAKRSGLVPHSALIYVAQ
jgi:hypothetical protein